MSEILRVLYAEDSDVDADLTSTHFRLHAPHIALEIVKTGRRCLARLEEETYDVLLLDHRLPDMDGIEVLKQVAPTHRSMPIVVVTGIGDEALVVQVLRLGASDYVTKEGSYLVTLASVLENAVTEYRTRHAQYGAEARPGLRILYAEHHAADIELTRYHFASAAAHIDLQVVHSSTEALAVLHEATFDLVLSDLRLPDMTALDLLREAKRRQFRMPFIVVTGKGDEQAAIAALKLGASDYIVKHENYLLQLPHAIENAVSRWRLLDANRRLQIELAERTRAEDRIRQLNTELEDRVERQTRALDAATQELEETAILELIAENAPLPDICARVAALLARRTQTVVSASAFPPADRVLAKLKAGHPPSGADAGGPDPARLTRASFASLAIATPDGTVESAPARHLADATLLQMLADAERLPARLEYPLRSAVTHTELGQLTLFLDDDRPLGHDIMQVIHRCTKLGAIAIHRAHSEERIRRQALEDPLTGVPNRVLWCDRLDQALAASRRDDSLVAVLLYDVDRFKDINDTLGHDVGDRVLRHAAAQLEHAMRPSDTVGRLGGDEFAVVVPRLRDVLEAQQVAQRGLTALEQPLAINGATVKPKASVGVAFHPVHGSDPDHLLRCADVAMYRAKRTGGGIGIYDPQRDQEQLDSLHFVAELQQAIDTDQLMLCYQPKIALRTGQTVGVECLVRWRHPTRGVIPPVQFIPLAESVGLIKPLSLWVIRQALEDCRSWHDRSVQIPVAVNLSAPLLYDPELLGTIQSDVRARDVREGHLEVEITESTLMLDPEQAMITIHQLRDSGIVFSLDDFGTGYSSLAYLKSLPVQSIKIDQSFVRDMVTDQRDASIVRAAIELGHSFNLDIIAEGVENLAVSNLLTQLGCDQAQGYYLAKPMVMGDFMTWYDGRQHTANR